MPAAFSKPNAPIALPWGPTGSLPVELPGDWPLIDVVWPDLSDCVPDYTPALEQALDAPSEAQPLEQAARAGSTVAIVVDDPSRWTPVREALPVILGRLLAAGVRPADVSICVGVGRHHAVDDAAMRERVGDAIVAQYRCFSPPVDDLSQYADLGETPEGVPVRVFRPVAEADLRILIGSVLPHLQAGFGGGYKLIFPGTSHRSTLGALHRMGLKKSPAGPSTQETDSAHVRGLLGSAAAENPMRQAIRSAAARLRGPCFSVSHLLGAPGQVMHVCAGHPDAVQDMLAVEARRRLQAPAAPLADIVVAGNHPWPGDPMQSFKVLLQHREAGRPGGVLAGFFWTDPEQIDRSFPILLMRAIAATSAPGGWVMRRGLALATRASEVIGSPSAFMLRWARELVVDRTVLVYAPPLCERIGPRLGPVRLFANQGELWQAAAACLARAGCHAPQVRVFPQGGLTYCPRHAPAGSTADADAEANAAGAPVPYGRAGSFSAPGGRR